MKVNGANGGATRRHGIATLLRDHPAYRYMRGVEGDGVFCEKKLLQVVRLPAGLSTTPPGSPDATCRRSGHAGREA